MHEKALLYLNEAIELEPRFQDARKERAISYFELERFELALKEYQHVYGSKVPYRGNHLQIPLLIPLIGFENFSTLEFSKGLLYGSLLGSREGTIEFVSSIRGSLSFLWSFACSPVEVSKELIEALIDIGNFLAHGRINELIEVAVPELSECRRCWDSWSDYTKGQKMGFIVSKYSISVFYYVSTAAGGICFYNALRRENMMAILGRYVKTHNTLILKESSELAKKSRAILNKASRGSVVAHNSNVAPHVMQKKHMWEKVIEISGNIEEDFRKVVLFLDNQKILNGECKLNSGRNGIKTYKYTKNYGREKIVAYFEVTEDGIPLLRNAYVKDIPKIK